jgi:HAD superfamily hydrolase (TIGR01509 family)
MLCITALAFDFDGTLIDISKPYSMAFNETLRNFGLPASNPIELYRRGASDLEAQFAQVFSSVNADKDLIQKCLKMHREIYMQIHLKYLKRFDKALHTVRELHSRGFKLALIGGRPIAQVEPELEFVGIRDCFDLVLTSDAVNRPKPAPDIVQRTAELLDISPEQILVVGDSPDDIASAKSAGAFSAGICSGYFSKEALIEAKPDFLLDSVSDVLGIVAHCSGTP